VINYEEQNRGFIILVERETAKDDRSSWGNGRRNDKHS
jgi:hypothetical protein